MTEQNFKSAYMDFSVSAHFAGDISVRYVIYTHTCQCSKTVALREQNQAWQNFARPELMLKGYTARLDAVL